MLRINDTLGGDPISFHYVEYREDLIELWEFVRKHKALGIDTESTGLNCYRPGWELRSVQIGNANRAYVIPAKYQKAIAWLIHTDTKWIAHNGTHDIRSIDAHIGYESGVVCAGETYLPAHYVDSRKQDEGGTGHGLKELSIHYISRDAGKWEAELKKAFKAIRVPAEGVYKSGPKKGQPKTRIIKLSEGWALIDPTHPAYIAYSAADPILTYRLWKHFQPVVKDNIDLYHFDLALQQAVDKLQRRAMRVDVRYTERLSVAFSKRAEAFTAKANAYGCNNINSGKQLADVLVSLGVVPHAKTPTGQYKTDNKILREIAKESNDPKVKDFIRAVLGAKQVLKRRENYTEAFLREMDSQGRVHPSINTLAARTARMSVSNPPLQQLPTANHEEDVE